METRVDIQQNDEIQSFIQLFSSPATVSDLTETQKNVLPIRSKKYRVKTIELDLSRVYCHYTCYCVISFEVSCLRISQQSEILVT